VSDQPGPSSGWCQYGRFARTNPRSDATCKQRTVAESIYCKTHRDQAMQRVASVKHA